jgi:hypothetical protein
VSEVRNIWVLMEPAAIRTFSLNKFSIMVV